MGPKKALTIVVTQCPSVEPIPLKTLGKKEKKKKNKKKKRKEKESSIYIAKKFSLLPTEVSSGDKS